MAAVGFTPISLYYSTTPTQAPSAGNLVAGELALNTADGKLYFKNSSNVVTLLASSSGASGDVVGPGSATDDAVVRFDGTTGKLVQNSAVTIADTTGNIAGLGDITFGTQASKATLTYATNTARTLTVPNVGGNRTFAFIDEAQTFSADQTIGGNLTLNAQGDVRFADSDSSNWVAFQGAATIASNVTWTLPNADGTSGQVLQTNGSGVLSFTTPSGGITTGKSIAMAMIFGF
jgi:hypothetical protein